LEGKSLWVFKGFNFDVYIQIGLIELPRAAVLDVMDLGNGSFGKSRVIGKWHKMFPVIYP
jgi:hypothetical protein